jgi:LacI family transcriptional regulator
LCWFLGLGRERLKAFFNNGPIAEVRSVPTLADVAKVAGVGVMSVSRVVNGTRKVSAETEKKVRAAIRRIGYEPSEAAKILKGHRAHVLGLIVPDIADPFFAVCANAIQLSAREAGYMTLMVASDHQAAIEKQQAELMMQRQIAGLITVPMVAATDYFVRGRESGLPIVAMDRPLRDTDADAVLVDNRDASARMIEHLLIHGHRNILCVTDEEKIFTRLERLTGYTQGMHDARLNPRICMVGPVSGTFAEQFPAIIATEPRPTAIFALNDLLTVEVIRHLQHTGVNIGHEMAVTGFDDFDAATLITPRITVVRQPVVEMGRRAVSMLLQRIEGRNTEPGKHTVLKTELIIRESCGCGLAKTATKRKRTGAGKR